MSRRQSGRNSDARHPRSGSSGSSLDVAANLFTSTRTLEASGRSLSSLWIDSGLADNNLSADHRSAAAVGTGALFQAALPTNIYLGRVGGLGSMGTSLGQNNLFYQTTQYFLPPPPCLGDSLGDSFLRPYSFEMDDVIRQQQQHNSTFQRPLLDTINESYLQSSKLRGSTNVSNEICNVLTRCQSERSMASSLFLSEEDITKTRLISELSHLSDLESRMQFGTKRDSETSRSSLDLLAAASTNVNAMNENSLQTTQPTSYESADKTRKPPAVEGASGETSPTQSKKQLTQKVGVDGGGEEPETNLFCRTLAVLTVPTCFSPTKKRSLKRRKIDIDESDCVSDVSDENPKITRTKTKRALSTSSFDALLSALGDDLATFDEKNAIDDDISSVQSGEDNTARRKSSKDSHFSCFHNQSSNDLICQQDDLSTKGRRHQLARLRDGTGMSHPLLSMESGAMIHPIPAMNFDNDGKMESSNSMIISIKSAMMRNAFALREARREFATRMLQKNQQNKSLQNNSLQNINHPGPPRLSSNVKNVSHYKKEDDDVSPITKEDPKIPPAEALKSFLSAYGEKAETLRSTMLKAISDTERSLATLHSWDRSQGLRKCHNRTAVKTRKTRANIKAFLKGVEPPREPYLNRKRSKKTKK